MVYKWYILPIGCLYATYHLLREPGNSIDVCSKRTEGRQPLVRENVSRHPDGRFRFYHSWVHVNIPGPWILWVYTSENFRNLVCYILPRISVVPNFRRYHSKPEHLKPKHLKKLHAAGSLEKPFLKFNG